jgi:putative PEP-CTERM system TPR-repeat lipoprotein
MPRHATKLTLIAALVSGAFLIGGGLAACGRTQSAESLLAEAKQYQQKGDLKAALIQLKNAVEKSPENGNARLQLATLELRMGGAASAEKEARKARSLGIAADAALPLQGKAMLQQGRFKEMLDEITPELAARSAPLLSLRGDALLATGKADDAKQAYDQALGLNPNSGDALLGLARHAMTRNDREAAERYAADAASKDANNPEVWMFHGALLRVTGKPEEALGAYDKALALDPQHRSAHIEKAYIEISRGKFAEAKTEIDAAEKATPGSMLVTYTRALSDFSQGKFAAAQESVQKVLKNAPEHLPSILLAGASEMNLGATQQAEMHLRKYLASIPNDVYARKLLAQTLLKSSQPADAAAALAPVLNDSTNDPQLLALAGESYMQVRDFDKASAYLEKAAALAPKAAAVRTSLGLSRLGQGNSEKGLSELELAATLDPKSSQAAMVLVQTELELKHYDKALAAVQSLEKQQVDNPQVYNMKGVVYLMKGDKANARAAFEKAVALQPTYFPAVTNLSRLDLQDSKPEVAKQRFEKVLEKDKNNYGAMAALGELALLQKHNDEATSWFEKGSSANPDAVVPAVRLGTHYLRINQPQKALTLARKYLATNPTNPDLLELQGQAQVASKDPSAALETYGKLVNVLPKSAPAQLRLAGVHMMLKNEAAAAADIKRAIEVQPAFIPARLAQIELALRTHRTDDALAQARQLQKLNGKLPVGYAVEGDVLLVQNKPAEALGAYEKAQSISKAPEMLVKILQVMSNSGKGKEAEARGAQWLKEHPNDALVSMFLADRSLASKDFKPAISLLENALKQNPNNPVALNNLAWAYQQQKDPRALDTAEQAFKVAGDNPGVMDTLGWMLVEQGNTARGLPLLQKASGLAPNAPEIRYHLAVGLNKSGDKQGARKELDKLLADNKPFAQIEEARALLKTL